ncbi:Glycosyltransferase involved in cell wall bisynthesis [Chitinophaga costaii]|uniref:Glycosyltransferase involved in cell wall bisynthesis n=1 Tax=Chitinophaga costaii TaxID=1335309 RepID=A0A1C4FIW1_9BACT|nr:glycosyltransferase [Chitinophaga costaii]PUZ20296.1 glycosyltransferase family 1 protein [Chitinophaga costaii]SCC55565.1 Glycosyltransferase involved in cell wall bisynthesis [Chitinophaga costaii]
MNTQPTKIKVLQAIRQGLIGGGESHVLGLVEQLDKLRFEPIVLSFSDGQMIRQLERMGIHHYVIPSGKAFDLRTARQVKALLRQEQIDLVHAHGSRAASNLLLPARSLKIPMLYTIHGWSFHDDQPFLQKTLRVWSEKLLTSRVQRNISVSASNQLTGQQHFSSFRSVVVNNGINLQKFNDQGTYPDIRPQLGIPAHHTLVGYIARITLQKDPFTLLHAFHEVLQHTQDITLLVVGEGDLRDRTVALASELGIAGNIVFQDFREDVPAILQATDIYCLPSLWEGLPIGLLEAMATRNAVIVTDVDGSREIIKDRQNGLMIPVQHKMALAAAILELHHNKPFRIALQNAAQESVRTLYSVDQMARKIEQQYLEVLSVNRYQAGTLPIQS